MNRSDYQTAFDKIPFDRDFQRKTIQTLHRAAGQIEKKEVPFFMKKRRLALMAAALSILLILSAAAAVVWLTPKEVALHVGQEALAQAFESDQSIILNQEQQVGDFNVTLMGMVSGESLSALEEKYLDIKKDRTYVALSFVRADNQPITDETPPLTVSPLVEGYAPWEINAWTLGGNVSYFTENGVFYYLFECDNVESFADHKVFLAVYPGAHVPPSAELFHFDAQGAITVCEGSDVALFTLPLDPTKADAQKVNEILNGHFQPVPSQSPAEEGAAVIIEGQAEELIPAPVPSKEPNAK